MIFPNNKIHWALDIFENVLGMIQIDKMSKGQE